MATIIIEDNNPQARRLLEFIRTLPYATVLEEKKSSRRAIEECHAVPISTFTHELHRQIDEYFDSNA